MIVSHRWKFVYLGPPKTATTALHRWLSQPAFCKTRWTPQLKDQHAILIPPEAAGYFVFASVRHPLDRCVSLWAHSQSRVSLAADDSWPMSFDQFVLEYQPQASWFYSMSQSELLAPVRLDAVVRFDRLEEDLHRLPPIAAAARAGKTLEPLRRLNETRHPPRHELYTPRLAEVVAYRWGADWEFLAVH